jgi:hypothetical protein
MMPTADLFVRAYVLVDDALKAGAVAVPPRPGPAPACTDAGVLTVALTTTGEITEHLGLARHRAKTFWGLLARTAATILAHTLLRLGLA